MKAIFKTLKWIFIALVLAVLTLPLWIGPAVKYGSESAVPKITKTPFHLGEFALNQYTGRLKIGDMQLWNPERFYTDNASAAKNPLDVKSDGVLSAVANQAKNAVAAAGDAVAAVGDTLASSETNAVSLGSLEVKLSPLSVFTDTIRIREIKIEKLFIYGDLSFANLREIASNASGDDEGENGAEDAKDEKDGGKDSGDGKKVAIDRVFITGAKIQWGRAAVPLPDIEIKDIGKKDGDDDGASAEDAGDAIVKSVCDAADKVCAGAGTALKLALDGADAVAGAAGAVAGGVADAAKGAADAAKSIASGTTDAAKSIASGTTDAAKGIASGTADAAKGIASGTADAAKNVAGAAADAAKGAADAVKNLFK